VAKDLFERCFEALHGLSPPGTMFCLERLSDLSQGMSGIDTTMTWATLYLAQAMKYKDRLAVLKALHSLGQILAAGEDIEAALKIFRVALEGFTDMGVHQWKGKCLVHIAHISERGGDFEISKELRKSAKDCFQRSYKDENLARMEAKIPELEVGQ
jgi:hypothetical protein